MRQFILLLSICTLMIACKETSKKSEAATTSTPQPIPDSTAIATTIHNFYKWYNIFSVDTSKRIDFTEAKGKHLKINEIEFKKYLSELMKTGCISEEFLTNEDVFFRKCEKLWQNEDLGDVPSGMDADRFYCAQDGVFEEFTTAKVTSAVNGDRAKAVMTFNPDGGNGKSRNFELKKENGKWLLTLIECDTGVK
jgi:Protein of unknown function (DUF3828)